MMGMVYDQFWHDSPSLFFIYLDAYERKRQEEQDRINYTAWLHGVYIDYALTVNHPFAKKKGEYIKEPLSFKKNKENEVHKMSDKEREEFELKKAEILFKEFGKYTQVYNKVKFGEEEGK